MGNTSSIPKLVGGAGCHCHGKGGSSSQNGGYIVPSERKRASGRGITLKGKSRKGKSRKGKSAKKGGKPRTAKKTRSVKRTRTAKAGRRHSRK